MIFIVKIIFKNNFQPDEVTIMREDRTISAFEWEDPDVIWLMESFIEKNNNYRLIRFEDGSFCYVREE